MPIGYSQATATIAGEALHVIEMLPSPMLPGSKSRRVGRVLDPLGMFYTLRYTLHDFQCSCFHAHVILFSMIPPEQWVLWQAFSSTKKVQLGNAIVCVLIELHCNLCLLSMACLWCWRGWKQTTHTLGMFSSAVALVATIAMCLLCCCCSSLLCNKVQNTKW